MDLNNIEMKLYKPELKDLDVDCENFSSFDIVQPKHDGWFVILSIERNVATVITSGGEIRSSFQFPAPDAVILCEWIYGTNWAQSSPDLGKFVAFDVTSLSGVTIRDIWYGGRLSMLEDYLNNNYNQGQITIVDTFRVEEWKDIWKRFVIDKNYEGVVFKHTAGKFGFLQARMKKVVTWNYAIIGFKEGTKRLEGTLGALVAGLYVDGKVVRIMDVGGGFSDVLRREIWDNKDQYLGMCFEARGKQHFDTGALRHPAFTKFRPDLTQEECTK